MTGMPKFTFDVESIDLANEELTAFAYLVNYTCHLDDQHRLSTWLAKIRGPQPGTICDLAWRQARRMWRTEIRL